MAITKDAWLEAGQLLASWHKPLLFSHVRPDGDAIGALLAMGRVCRLLGAAPTVVLYDDPPAKYRDLIGSDTLVRWPDPARTDAADGILVLDTCSWQQLEPVAEFLRRSPLPRIVVDHHKTWNVLAGPESSGPIVGQHLIDETASACCLLVHDWLRAVTWPIDAGVAAAIFVGIATDTGWFRFSNADARTMATAGDLVAAGVQPDRWYAAMYETFTPARLRLEGAMLARIEVSDGDKLIWSVLTNEMFAATGASRSETEDLIQTLQRLDGVVASALFAEEPDGRIRVSLRSKAPYVCGQDVDVAAIAAALGGGGHARAAGIRLTGPMADAQRQVLAAIRRALHS
jgi:phosphoesterase RecJ-like protein